MSSESNDHIELHDLKPSRGRFLAEVLRGLQKSPKELPPKYFYDELGSSLFEHICTLGEYYIPRVEAAIMRENIKEMAELLGPQVLLIEFGSGDCAKTRTLLDHLPDLAAYVPFDISREQLLRTAEELASDYPAMEVLPVCADYTSRFELPALKQAVNRVVVYFAGSNIGNFEPSSAKHFLEQVAQVCGEKCCLLIGVDLKKDPDVLHRAYNDSQGITADFNLNLLKRINRELSCDFLLDCFEHHAFYNPREGRVEMHLVSLRDQTIHLNNTAITLARGERIHTENSYKFTLNEFEQLAASAGFKVEHVWTDQKQWFSIQYLVNMRGRSS